MSITGGAKFFQPSLCLSANGATAVASNGSSSAIYCLDLNPYTYFYTVGSSDASTETLTISFNGNQTISRLLLLDHNFKQFGIKYLNGSGSYVDFTNVVGLDATIGTISETVFSDSSAYYEFDAVSTSGIQVTVSKTQVANADKYLAGLIATTEIGTLAGYPTITPIIPDRNSKVAKTLSGKVAVQKSDESTSFMLQFKTYPSSVAYNVDIDLMMTLNDQDAPFLAWLCGGRRGSTYFNYTLRGFRLKDVYQMHIKSALNLQYTANVTKNSLNCQVDMAESI